MKNYIKYISLNPSVRSGQHCITITSITVGDVGDILSYLALDMSIEEIIADFPELTKDSILAALGYAAEFQNRTSTLEDAA